MSVLEDINSLVLDLNRDIQALVFFLRTPPRINTNEKFVSLAQTATGDFRALQAKAAEATDAYPDADTSLMSLDLAIDAIQAFLVSSIKQMRDCIRDWIESQDSFTPGPSLAFLPTITAEMANFVESVISSTKSIKKIIQGDMRMPAPIVPRSEPADYPDIEPQHAEEVNQLFSSPSTGNINSYLVPSSPIIAHPTQGGAMQAAARQETVEAPSFESLLAEFEKKERKEARLARKRADTAMKQSLKRAGIQIDSETLDAIVLQLSEIASLFLYESNNFGQRSDGTLEDYVMMSDLDEKRTKIQEHAIALHTASIDMESFLTQHHQISLAKMTTLHMSDVMTTMKQVINEAPNVSWDSLRHLDVAIKDFAGTIRDVVQLSNPEYVQVLASEGEEEDDDSVSGDEPPPIVKPTRLLTKEEELLLAFDGFADALDALDVSLTTAPGAQPSPASSLSSTSTLSTNGLSSLSGHGSSSIGGSSAGYSCDSNADQSDKTGLDYGFGPSYSPSSPISSSPLSSKPSTQSAPSSLSLSTIKSSVSASSSSPSSPSSAQSPRDPNKSTLQFSVMRPSTMSNSVPMLDSAMNAAKESGSSSSKSTRPQLTATRSNPVIEATYEIADEAVCQADLTKVVDRWSEMQARSEEQRTIVASSSPDGSSSPDLSWESSKVKAALKFMSKKVGDIRKAVGGTSGAAGGSSGSGFSGSGGSGGSSSASSGHTRLASSGSIPTVSGGGGSNRGSISPSGSSSSLAIGSSSNPKRRTMMVMSPSSNSDSGSTAAAAGGNSPSSSPTGGGRRSLQLASSQPSDPRCFLFEEPDDDSVLRTSPESGAVVAGTLEKLVQRLTHDSMSDPNFILHFLITYKCFTTSSELLELLILRWDTAPPPYVDPSFFDTSRLPSIRLRVYNVLKTWIEKFWNDLNEPELIERLKVFAGRMHDGGMSSASQTLTKIIQKNLEHVTHAMQLPEPPTVHDFVRRSRRETPIASPTTPVASSSESSGDSTMPTSSSSSSETGAPLMPAILTISVTSLSRPLTMLDFHPEELARQISRMEFELWKQVKNVELLEVAWTKKDKEKRAPNVLNMIHFSNHITSWMISEVLAPNDPKDRSVVLNRCVWMVKYFLELRNFNAAMETLSAFHSSPIYRLKSTWNCLPATSWNIFESLEKVMSPDANFKTYRNEYDRSVPPYMPYLGTHLSDLLFLEETIPRFLDSSSSQLINFSKMEKTAQFIQTLELSQQIPYSITPVPIIMSYIKEYPVLDQKEAYNRSLECEARAKKNRPNSSYLQTQTSPPTISRPVTLMGPESPSSSSPSSKPSTQREMAPGSL